MKASTKDQAEGQLLKVKGTIKEIAGSVGMNPELVEEGQNEQRTGAIKQKIGEVEKVVGK